MIQTYYSQQFNATMKQLHLKLYIPGGVPPEKLGRGVWLTSQNPYRFTKPLPYLWRDQKFDTLFMTCPINLSSDYLLAASVLF